MKLVLAWLLGVAAGVAVTILGRIEKLFEDMMREQMELHGVTWIDEQV